MEELRARVAAQKARARKARGAKEGFKGSAAPKKVGLKRPMKLFELAADEEEMEVVPGQRMRGGKAPQMQKKKTGRHKRF